MQNKAGFMGLPIRYEKCWLDTFDKHDGVEAAIAWCKRYADDFTKRPGHGLYLQGMAGVGKTHLAVATVNEILHQHQNYLGYARFAGVPELVMLTRKNRATNAGLFVYDCIEAPLLLLDDLGSEEAAADSRAMLYTILTCRYDECLPTVITSTLDEIELEDRYGDKFLSRIYSMCSPVELSATDYRQTGTDDQWPSFGA